MTEFNFDVVFRQYSSYVAAICVRLLGRDSDVDDCVQDVFLAAANGMSRIRDPNALKGWLATISVRTARKRLRTRRFKMFLNLDETPEYERVAAPDATPEETAIVKNLYEALDALPVDDRMAWTLRYVHQEKLEQVADLCECSLATAKRRIARAHDALSKIVGSMPDTSARDIDGGRAARQVAVSADAKVAGTDG